MMKTIIAYVLWAFVVLAFGAGILTLGICLTAVLQMILMVSAGIALIVFFIFMVFMACGWTVRV